MSLRRKDHWIRILALLLAILMWFYVSNELNPMTDLNIKSLPLTIRDAPADYVLTGIPETVDLRIKSNRHTAGLLQRSDFSVYLTIPADIEAGQWKLPVQVLPPPGVEVLRVTPKVVEVQADELVSTTVPVVVKLTGTPAPGWQAGEPLAEPAQVRLQGPGKVMAGLSRIQVSFDLGGADSTQRRSVALMAPAQGVTVQPAGVTVTVPVTDLPVADLPVQVDLRGDIHPAWEIGNIIVEPSMVRLTGQKNILEELTAIKTVPVDLSGLNGDLQREVGLAPPAGINILSSPQVLVKVQVKPKEEAKPAPDPNDDDLDQNGSDPENENKN